MPLVPGHQSAVERMAERARCSLNEVDRSSQPQAVAGRMVARRPLCLGGSWDVTQDSAGRESPGHWAENLKRRTLGNTVVGVG